MFTTATISYLDSVTPSGDHHLGWQDRRPAFAVAPTVVTLALALPVEVSVGWGDRCASAATLTVFTAADALGVSMTDGEDGEQVRCGGAGRYSAPLAAAPEWASSFRAAVAEIRRAAAAAERDRPEVRTVCEVYRRILMSIDREHASHRAQWERDVERIAAAFRRRFVDVGEQTVPGLCVVRSSRGRTLGYARIRDGAWTGSVVRA
jgi:hypothetical protein